MFVFFLKRTSVFPYGQRISVAEEKIVRGSVGSSYIMHADAALQDPMGLLGIIAWFKLDRRAGIVRKYCSKSPLTWSKHCDEAVNPNEAKKKIQQNPKVGPGNSTCTSYTSPSSSQLAQVFVYVRSLLLEMFLSCIPSICHTMHPPARDHPILPQALHSVANCDINKSTLNSN